MVDAIVLEGAAPASTGYEVQDLWSTPGNYVYYTDVAAVSGHSPQSINRWMNQLLLLPDDFAGEFALFLKPHVLQYLHILRLERPGEVLKELRLKGDPLLRPQPADGNYQAIEDYMRHRVEAAQQRAAERKARREATQGAAQGLPLGSVLGRAGRGQVPAQVA